MTLKDERALELVRKGLLPHDAAGECAAPRWQHAAVTTDTPPHTVRAGRIPHVELSQLVLLPQLTTPEAIAAAETLVRAFVHARAQPGKPLPPYAAKAYWATVHPAQQKAIATDCEGDEGIWPDRRFLWCESLGKRLSDDLIHSCVE